MKLYMLNLNPCNKYQYFNKADRLSLFRRYIADLMHDIPGKISGVVCISFPAYGNQGDLGPRLHLHSLLSVNEAEFKDFLIKTYYSLLRTTGIQISEVQDLNKTLNYIYKQNITFLPELGNISMSDLTALHT